MKVNKEQEITLLYQLIEKHFGSGVLMQFEDLTETDSNQLLNRIETMTTYNTYQEAKIANPESEIYVLSRKTALMVGKFQAINDAPTSHFASGWTKCDPSKYCMTVEKFLADGNELTEGDVIINANGNVNAITSVDCKALNLGGHSIFNDERFILRAAALETKEPKRTKVEYVNVELTRKEFACELINGNSLYTQNAKVELYFDEFNGKMKGKNSNGHSWDVVIDHGTYLRRIETPIEWWEDAAEFINQHGFAGFANGKLEAQVSMTRDQWCDFARILLEQGE